MKANILFIDTDSEPVITVTGEAETADLDAPELQRYLLKVLNEMGKNSHAVVSIDGGDKMWMFSHTSQRGPSSALYREPKPLRYHRYADLLKR